MTELFLKWTERPEVRAALFAKYETDQKRQTRIAEAIPYLRQDKPLPADEEYEVDEEEDDDETEADEADESTPSTPSTKSTAEEAEEEDETFTPEFFPETYAAMRAQKAAPKARRKTDPDAAEPAPRKPDTYTEVAPGIKFRNVPPAFAAYHAERATKQKDQQESTTP